MIQCPGSPASSRLCRRPLTKLSSITTTITTIAIPSAVISEVVRRTIRLRRLYVIGITAIHDRVEIRRQTKFIPVLAVIDRVRPRRNSTSRWPLGATVRLARDNRRLIAGSIRSSNCCLHNTLDSFELRAVRSADSAAIRRRAADRFLEHSPIRARHVSALAIPRLRHQDRVKLGQAIEGHARKKMMLDMEVDVFRREKNPLDQRRLRSPRSRIGTPWLANFDRGMRGGAGG